MSQPAVLVVGEDSGARHAGCCAFVGKPLVPSEVARVAGELLS